VFCVHIFVVSTCFMRLHDAVVLPILRNKDVYMYDSGTCDWLTLFSSTRACVTAMAKAYSTYIAPQATTAAVLLCDRQSRRTAYRPSAKPAHTDSDLQPNSHTQPCLPFNGLHPIVSTPVKHVITWLTTHLPTPEGLEG